MMEFLYMGGYAGYVWSAHAAVLAVFLANLVHAHRRRGAVLRRLRRLHGVAPAAPSPEATPAGSASADSPGSASGAASAADAAADSSAPSEQRGRPRSPQGRP